MRSSKKNSGFTLMEMILTIAVGSVLFISISRAAQTLLEAVIDDRNYFIAYNLAKRQMAIINNAAYPGVMGETAQTAHTSFPNFIPTEEVSTLYSATAPSGTTYTLRQITVRVRHGSSAGPVLVRLDTYRSDAITFGTGS